MSCKTHFIAKYDFQDVCVSSNVFYDIIHKNFTS